MSCVAANQKGSWFLHFLFEILMFFYFADWVYILHFFCLSLLKTWLSSFQVNLAETSAGKEARIQEVEAKFTHCQAICNRITQV
jgi:hypothetical protein